MKDITNLIITYALSISKILVLSVDEVGHLHLLYRKNLQEVN